MDETFFCPDCGAEHLEPIEATLGHFARCVDCVVVAEAREPVVHAGITLVEVRVAA
jgi:hypothetical protein